MPTKNSDVYQSNQLKPFSAGSSDPYVTAGFSYDNLPQTFVIGDGRSYTLGNKNYINQPLTGNTAYILFVRFIETEVIILICLSVRLFVCLFLFICLFVCLFISLIISLYLLVPLFAYLFTSTIFILSQEMYYSTEWSNSITTNSEKGVVNSLNFLTFQKRVKHLKY